MAQVQEARGNRPLAEEYYRKAAAFVKGKPGFDQEFENWLLEQASNLEKKTTDQDWKENLSTLINKTQSKTDR